MSLEGDIYSALSSLVSGRVFPDLAPHETAVPYITYQQIGGAAENFLEATFVGKRNSRVQINCWASTRLAANDLARDAEEALIESDLKAYVLGAFGNFAPPDPGDAEQHYGTHQDFSVWY